MIHKTVQGRSGRDKQDTTKGMVMIGEDKIRPEKLIQLYRKGLGKKIRGLATRSRTGLYDISRQDLIERDIIGQGRIG